MFTHTVFFSSWERSWNYQFVSNCNVMVQCHEARAALVVPDHSQGSLIAQTLISVLGKPDSAPARPRKGRTPDSHSQALLQTHIQSELWPYLREMPTAWGWGYPCALSAAVGWTLPARPCPGGPNGEPPMILAPKMPGYQQGGKK